MPTNISSTLMILFLLCISLHACNGRHLRLMNEDHEKEFGLSNSNTANDQKGTISESPKLIPSLMSNEHEVAEQSSLVKETRVLDDGPKKNESDQAKREELKDQQVTSKDAAHSHDSLVSFSWRVPRKNKHTDQHPGFNLDYTPPKTHPPIHN